MQFDELRLKKYVRINLTIIDNWEALSYDFQNFWYGIDLKAVWEITSSTIRGDNDDYVLLEDVKGSNTLKLTREEYLEYSNEIYNDILVVANFNEALESMWDKPEVVLDVDDAREDMLDRVLK